MKYNILFSIRLFFCRKSSEQFKIIARFIISINRNSTIEEANSIAALAIEYYKTHPDVVVGIELSGDPSKGQFVDFKPALFKAKNEGMKVCNFLNAKIFSTHSSEIV